MTTERNQSVGGRTFPCIGGYRSPSLVQSAGPRARELGWREFEDQQLKRYLDLGLARERLLLRRAPDSQRAAVIATQRL